MSVWFERYAHPRWAAAEPYWGMWCIPQFRLPVLPGDLVGATAVELGCGTAYVSAWLASRDAHPVGVGISARQLSTARRTQAEFGLSIPVVRGDAERVPLAAACADLVISEYGARLLRPAAHSCSRLSPRLARMCMPAEGLATERLARDRHTSRPPRSAVTADCKVQHMTTTSQLARVLAPDFRPWPRCRKSVDLAADARLGLSFLGASSCHPEDRPQPSAEPARPPRRQRPPAGRGGRRPLPWTRNHGHGLQRHPRASAG
jgi:SAM-dependent methyltransferase